MKEIKRQELETQTSPKAEELQSCQVSFIFEPAFVDHTRLAFLCRERLHTHILVYIYVYISMYVCMHVCVYVCLYYPLPIPRPFSISSKDKVYPIKRNYLVFCLLVCICICMCMCNEKPRS